MAAEKTYNGWTNYETWNVALWLGNEQGSYTYWTEQAQERYKHATASKTFTQEEQAVLDFAAALKEEFETEMHDWLDASKRSASVWADLLGAALSEVNWHEIAQHYIDDVEKGGDE